MSIYTLSVLDRLKMFLRSLCLLLDIVCLPEVPVGTPWNLHGICSGDDWCLSAWHRWSEGPSAGHSGGLRVEFGSAEIMGLFGLSVIVML